MGSRGASGVDPSLQEGERLLIQNTCTTISELRERAEADRDVRYARRKKIRAIDQLINALALVWGTEAVLVLRDVCRLDTEQAKDTMLRASRWMLDGFLAQHQPRKR